MSELQDLRGQVRLLQDRYEIERATRTYCRAIDRCDAELLKSIYHPDATDDHGSFQGNAHEFADFIVARLREVTSYGIHMVTNTIVDIDGEKAVSETSNWGYHRVFPGRESIESYFGEEYADRAEDEGVLDQEHEYLCGGRYLDQFERRADGVWRIAKRRITVEWSQCQVTSHVFGGSRGLYNLPGARDRSDPLYSLLASL